MRRLVLLGLVLAPLAPAVAQSGPGRLVVSGVAQRVQYHVQSTGLTGTPTVEEQGGLFVGVEGSARLGILAVSTRSVMGSLVPGGELAGGPDRASRVTSLAVHIEPSPLLAFGPEIEAIRFDTDMGVVAYRFIGASGRATIPLGSSFSGSVDGAFFPAKAVSGNAEVSVALRVGVAVQFAPSGGPFFASVGYRLDRIDFAQGSGRLEQFRGLTLGAGLRLGR